LNLIVPLKQAGSCGIIARLDRNSERFMLLVGILSISIDPGAMASLSRKIAFIKLPD
jgi:hypothetical protein